MLFCCQSFSCYFGIVDSIQQGWASSSPSVLPKQVNIRLLKQVASHLPSSIGSSSKRELNSCSAHLDGITHLTDENNCFKGKKPFQAKEPFLVPIFILSNPEGSAINCVPFPAHHFQVHVGLGVRLIFPP